MIYLTKKLPPSHIPMRDSIMTLVTQLMETQRRLLGQNQ